MGNVINLVGQKFGRLLVLERAENKGGQAYWVCKCDCGNIKTICGKSLRNGLTKSCGCLQKEKAREQAKNLVGQKFGRLTVLERIPNQIPRKVRWRCLCDCGNYVEVNSAELLRGQTKSCGCYKCERLSQVNTKDLLGKKFGKLTVIGKAESKNNYSYWECLCECGNKVIVQGVSLSSGNTTSCGCRKLENSINRCKSDKMRQASSKAHKQHGCGNKGNRLYRIWCGMKTRCSNPNTKSYKNYGEKGVVVCEEWKNNFQAFYDWSMSHGYKEDLTIDRINPFGNYEPTNCRWATKAEQSRNKRVDFILKACHLDVNSFDWYNYTVES